MSRSEQSRVTANRGRAFALIVATAFAGACGDDSSEPTGDSGTTKPDAAVVPPKNDASVDAGSGDAGTMDAGRDAATVVEAGAEDAGPVDAGVVDAGKPAVPGDDAPVLSKVGFYKDVEIGPRILLAGSDVNGDVATYTVSCFDMAGEPVVVNLDGMDETQDTTFTAPIEHDAAVQEFFAKFLPSTEFLDQVKIIKVTVKDAAGHTSSEVTAMQMDEPRVSGKCDPVGFNARCQNNQLCAPSGSGFACQPVSTARMGACNSATIATLHPPTVTSVSGTLNGASFWDSPDSCVGGGGQKTGYRDRIVKLKLDGAAAKVTLSTGATPTFDSVLYKLSACGENPPACVDSNCACGDNDLVLTNVAAGDYYIVVDSYASAELKGDTFTLTATVE